MELDSCCKPRSAIGATKLRFFESSKDIYQADGQDYHSWREELNAEYSVVKLTEGVTSFFLR